MFDQIFDNHNDVHSNQNEIRRFVAEQQERLDQFADQYDLTPAEENTHVIFCEIERVLCEEGKLFSPVWYATRIIREFTSVPTLRSDFLTGLLWEQMRVKISYESDLKKQQDQVERLQNQSAEATKSLVERSDNWKRHCELSAQEILAEKPHKYGQWSELAGQILSEVESLSSKSEIKQAYVGKRSKNKPAGTDLIEVSTVAKFLSQSLKR